MRTIRVLIVDDMPEVRQELRTVLTLASVGGGGEAEDGIATIEDETSHDPIPDGNYPADEEPSFEIQFIGEAGNGLEAIREAERLLPDVVLMDLEMPVLDGYEATRRIKSAFPDCRVIALTVHGYDDARRKALQAGIDDFIVKGAPVETLVEAILSKPAKAF
jgi:DNA-binding NarL/FixJ family response regulator